MSFASQMDRQELHILRTSCAVVLIEVAVDLEGQLGIISEVPEGSIRLSPDGRLPHRRWSELLHRTRDTAESTKAVCCRPRLRGRRTRKFKSPSGEGAGVRRRQRSAHHLAGSPLRLRSVSAKPNSRQRCSLIWKISLAAWPPSKSVELLPSRRLAVRALQCWAQRHTRLALRLGPAQA